MSTLSLDPTFTRPGWPTDRFASPSVRRSPTPSADALTGSPMGAGPASLRLTRRGRVVVVAAALLIAFVVGVFVSAAGSVATEEPGTPAPTRIVQVHEGDTLWDVAADLDHGDDVRSTMATIEQLNAMSDSVLHPGQRLVVPAG